MGLFGRVHLKVPSLRQTARPLAAAPDHDGVHHDNVHHVSVDHDAVDPTVPDRPAIARPVQVLLAIGIEGQGPLSSAVELADAARTSSMNTEDAVARAAFATIIRAAAGGIVTGVGGFWTVPVATPLNVVEFYLQAARMVSTIATLRGHDVDDPEVREAVLQTLVRAQSESKLFKSVSATRGGALTRRLFHLLPTSVLLMANKAIGFRLLCAMAERLFGKRFGHGVPVIVGVAVATRDAWMMQRIAEQAKIEFPAKGTPVPRAQDQG